MIQRLRHRQQYVLFLLGILILVAALLVRYYFRDYRSPDYVFNVGRWYEFIHVMGGTPALRVFFADYSPPYLYLLILSNALLSAAHSLYGIKLIAIVFDVLSALAVYLIIETHTRRPAVALLGYALMLMAPTVIANSAIWGQADPVYTAFLLLAIWRVMKRDPRSGLVFFSIAFSIKLQAIFLLPLFLYMMLDGELKLSDLLIVPAVFLLLNIPAIALGRSLQDTLTIYFTQMDEGKALTAGAANIYQLLHGSPDEILGPAGVATAFIFVIVYGTLLRRGRVTIGSRVLLVSTTLLIAAPFFLPRMHDRYFYPADILSIVLACTDRRLRWLPFTVIGGSFIAYWDYLFHTPHLSLESGAVFTLISLAAVVFCSFQRVSSRDGETSNGDDRQTSRFFDQVLLSAPSRSVLYLVCVSIVLFGISIPVGNAVRAQVDQTTLAAKFSLGASSIIMRAPQAVRCQDRVQVKLAWSDAVDIGDLKQAHFFIHVLDQNRGMLAQDDAPHADFPVRLVDAFSEFHDIKVSSPASATQVELGLYLNSGNLPRYKALAYDGAQWPEDAVVVPVVDGVCESWQRLE